MVGRSVGHDLGQSMRADGIFSAGATDAAAAAGGGGAASAATAVSHAVSLCWSRAFSDQTSD